ncbi:hypothetical protein AAL_01437 [Moelleriella libera RCEF 2490]|uniref:Uncharacterized protein n=1 Tax=Moelleriella libera RCEF 2490 TaxID=1081109 RepID=A0A166RJS5_9HYPO|nr:hypothetical protein AAL_01437 [Moelleriella libera RCEF 2490]
MDTAGTEPLLTLLHRLQVEFQDVNLMTRQPVGYMESAELGCKLGLGLSFGWREETKQFTQVCYKGQKIVVSNGGVSDDGESNGDESNGDESEGESSSMEG